VDGTLLRTDGTVAPSDRKAIAAALAGGMVVTLATGRLSSSALPLALDLGLGEPLICADGAVLFCPRVCEPLQLSPLGPEALCRWLDCLEQHDLAPFLFSHGSVYASSKNIARYSWVAGWTPHRVASDDLRAQVRHLPAALITAIGIGPESAVKAANIALSTAAPINIDVAGADVTTFPIHSTDDWVLRLTPLGSSKGVGLSWLATRLGLTAADVAVVGDWYNDLPMFAWAGSSFAMGQAPEEVKRAAKRALTATATTGGAIAEALAHLGL
jgi:Cof subfamily protein (haloacid dehalogenase superfamily)